MGAYRVSGGCVQGERWVRTGERWLRTGEWWLRTGEWWVHTDVRAIEYTVYSMNVSGDMMGVHHIILKYIKLLIILLLLLLLLLLLPDRSARGGAGSFTR